ncbi:F-box protein [Quillaja saponaria]|uniref:F-box protein n=1 Tax=Quillaja saponaria TaxID=32244 RepID=A0AAD7PH25_QUISA|nr:F-box protein [Quillaja saponaria]
MLPLPSLRTLIAVDEFDPKKRFIKAFLTASPDSSHCLVLVVINPVDPYKSIGTYILAFAKPGRDKAWSRITGITALNDIVYFKGNLYGCAVNSYDVIVVVLIQIEKRRAILFAKPQLIGEDGDKSLLLNDEDDQEVDIPVNNYFFMKYLVDLDGELCLVVRYLRNLLMYTDYFKIFKIRVWPLGDQCLFLGNNYTFTCKATTVGEPSDRLLSNSIFFTHDNDLTPPDLDQGSYNILDNHISNSNKDSPNTNPPVCITPSLRFGACRKKLQSALVWKSAFLSRKTARALVIQHQRNSIPKKPKRLEHT